MGAEIIVPVFSDVSLWDFLLIYVVMAAGLGAVIAFIVPFVWRGETKQ